MGKKALLAVLCACAAFGLTGCWNYRGLNKLSIVSGMAVDLIPDSSQFKISYEVIDLTEGSKVNGPQTTMVEATGKTLFDAARNGKMRLGEKLYFGNMFIIVISEKIAAEEGLARLMDWLLRDAELRETMHLIVAREGNAEDILRINGINNAVSAIEIDSIIAEDQKTTASTSNTMLYQVFDILHSEGKSLTLPAFHIAQNNGESAIEANGIAVFRDEKLIGYLTPEESKYLLFVTNQVKGGVLTVATQGEPYDDVTLEISNSKSKCSYAIKDGSMEVNVEMETNVYLGEISYPFNTLDPEKITSLEAMAGASLKQAMESIIQKVQTIYRSDIFGFGAMVYRSDPKLWEQISGSWNDGYFPTLHVTVHAKVNILNSAFLKDTEEE